MAGRLIRVRGLVQGVGFRPFVWRLARELGLRGWVRNDGGGVLVAVDGENVPIFIERLRTGAPRLARIDAVESEPAAVDGSGFAILDSVGGVVNTAIGPDAATCPDCIGDICDPRGRRWRYAFTTCTHCGPRYSVTRQIPYDRAQTSLAGFPLCPACAAEYGDPADRRFHAETTCCPACGPRLALVGGDGVGLPGDPIAETLRRLRSGGIVAIKGLGGFHLACDARNAAAVAELRRRKQREEKPFAVMGLNEAAFGGLAQIGDGERALLRAAAAPVVLCRKGGQELTGIAPGLAWLGVMLPATPLHLLLWHEAAGRPAGTAWLDDASELLLVMTSANPHGEPLVTGNDEALARLAGGDGKIAEAFLMHDRDIVVRCDDSVVRAGPAFIRRARGYVPVPIPLAGDGPAVLALGGYLKNTVCVLRGREAFLSQHIGGLDNAAAIGFLEEVVAHLLGILDVRPEAVAHDLHPDFPSTHLARRLAQELGVPALGVAHHHAHVAALAAEHTVDGVLTGFALDGVGLGPDGGAWGGELLRVDGGACVRLGHVSPLRLPGGDRAAREPWRVAVAALHDAGLGARIDAWLARTWPGRTAGPLRELLTRDLRCPPTSSLGRWFDVAAALLGVRAETRYEGQAAMELEGLAAMHGPVTAPAGSWALRDGNLDLAPLLQLLLDCPDRAYGAALFHATLAAALADWVAAAVDPAKGTKIAVGGGCAMNAILVAALRERLAASGIGLLEARQAPPNDGGLALGQAWVARRRMVELVETN
ncbi:MAG: carbamoyltransferase HypF [Betaproteobacteria bacterium]|nr:carbamoyltransferase HypF [Betaproteobacteria bacterium]